MEHTISTIWFYLVDSLCMSMKDLCVCALLWRAHLDENEPDHGPPPNLFVVWLDYYIG